MTEPKVDLGQAKRLMDALYLPDDTIYAFAYHDRNKIIPPDQSRFLYRDGTLVRTFIEVADGVCAAVAVSVGVFEPEQPGRIARRSEDQCAGLSAFAIDIDPKNFEALVPGATTLEEVVEEVIRRLEQHGIHPHAVVRSGQGLHIYVFIERVTFTTNKERTQAKDIWYRLTQLLGGASDRYDLSSMLRVPGSLNRKSRPVQVEFMEQHTNLNAPRHTMDAIAKAVEHLPPLPADKAVCGERKRTGGKTTPTVLDGEVLKVDPWELHVLALALKLDPALAEARRVAIDAPMPKAGKLDRSKNEFRYVCRLLEVGVPAEVIRAEQAMAARGRVESESWRISTFQRALAHVFPLKSDVTSICWHTTKTSLEALFTSIERPAQEKVPSCCGKSPASPEHRPTIAVALARPGHGKTLGIVNWMASHLSAGVGRVGLCGSMVRDLLRHEYCINAAFPTGLSFELNGEDCRFDLDLPEDHDVLWAKLPDNLKRRIEPAAVAGTPQCVWTLEKVKAVVTDPASFYINSLYPQVVDSSLAPDENEDGPVLPVWAKSWDDPVLLHARAILKIRPRPDLCSAGRSARDLRDRRTCQNCEMFGCRANGRVGGTKSHWSAAPYGLLTHKAYETHVIAKPSLNRFDGIVFDELPGFVYRYAKLQVSAQTVKHDRAAGWGVKPIGNIIEKLSTRMEKLDDSVPKQRSMKTSVEAVLLRLGSASEKLKKKGSDLMQKARAGRLQCRAVKVHRMEPLLTGCEFALLVKFADVDVADEDNESDDGADTDPFRLLGDLITLRDFCGDTPLDVFMEADFDTTCEGRLCVWRPVNGWRDLLDGPDGQPRPAVILDATAGIDPRYLLAGHYAVEEVPDGEFPNTTVVLTAEKSVSKKAVKEIGTLDLAEAVVHHVAPYLDQMVDAAYENRAPGPPRLLVVTAKADMKEPLRQALAAFVDTSKLKADVRVEHFGGLRGRNDFRDYDAVYLTHTHRYDAAYYYGLELLLRDFGKPFDRQWVSKSTWNRKHSMALRHRAQAADIYQDVLRIGIRSDPPRRSFIFLPTSEAGLVVRVMRMLGGARLIPMPIS